MNVRVEVMFGVVVRGLNTRLWVVVLAGRDRPDLAEVTCGPNVLVEVVEAAEVAGRIRRVELVVPGRHLDVADAPGLADMVLSRFSRSDLSDACLAAMAASGPMIGRRVAPVGDAVARLVGLRTFAGAFRRWSGRSWGVRVAVRVELTNEPGVRRAWSGPVRPVEGVLRSLGVTVVEGAAATVLRVPRPVTCRPETTGLDRSVEYILLPEGWACREEEMRRATAGRHGRTAGAEATA